MRSASASRARNTDDDAYLNSLRQQTLAILSGYIQPGTVVALLDMPCQRNVGDSLIWAGEVQYLKTLGAKLVYSADMGTFDASDLRRSMPSGVVLLHGGGNFGDVWPGHQAHRERIVSSLPEYEILQLPQSVYFGSAVAAERADTALSRHANLTLLVRDRTSLERGAASVPNVRAIFCPDMALGADLPFAALREEADLPRVLVLARQDREAASGLSDIPDDWLAGSLTRTDWITPSTTGWRGIVARLAVQPGQKAAALRRRIEIPRLLALTSFHRRALSRRNSLNVSCGVKLLNTHDLIVSDRLHAHVMACLLGLPHVVLDNDHQKVGSVFDTYTGRFSTAHRARSLVEAHELAESLSCS